MKLNFKIRIKNPAFWIPLIAGVVTMFMGFLQMEPQDFSSWAGLWEAIVTFMGNPYFVVSVLIYILAAFMDPTTPGIGDSEASLAKNKTTDTVQDMVRKVQMEAENNEAAEAKKEGVK